MVGSFRLDNETVEVDSTFYAIPPSRTVRGWYDRTPPGFQFALKLPQEITHERKLRDAESLAEEFFDRARELQEKLLSEAKVAWDREYNVPRLPERLSTLLRRFGE